MKRMLTAMRMAALALTIFTVGGVMPSVLSTEAHAQLIPNIPLTPPKAGPGLVPHTTLDPADPVVTKPVKKDETGQTKGNKTTHKPSFTERQWQQLTGLAQTGWKWFLSIWPHVAAYVQVAALALFVVLRIWYHVQRQGRNMQEDALARADQASEPEFGRFDEEEPLAGSKEVWP